MDRKVSAPKPARTEPYVLDATLSPHDGLFCFCPVEGDLQGDYQIVTGLNYLSTEPPPTGYLAGVIHEDGQAAVEKWCEQHRTELEKMPTRTRS